MVTKIQIAGKLKFYTKPYGRQWKWRYQVHGRMVEPKLKVPKTLANVKLVDPLHPEPVAAAEKPKWMPPRRHPVLESFFPQPTIKDHPDYNAQPIKLFDRLTKFHAGIDQACLLTKTKPVHGLPAAITSSVDDLRLTNQDSLVEAYIRQALAFDATKEECPRLEIPNDPKFRLGKEYATPPLRQMWILLDNMLRLCNINVYKRYPGAIGQRALLQETPLSTIVNRGDDLIQIRRTSDFTLFSKRSTAESPVADESAIAATSAHNLIDMYPIFPTVDLTDEHVYSLDDCHTIGWRGHAAPSSPPVYNNVHTFFHANDDQLATDADAARLVMFAFGYAFAQSQILKQNNSLELKENLELKKPIVVNGVSITNERLNYVSFQLNTLNLSDNAGVKNLVFHDLNNELYFNRPTVDKLPYPTHKNIQRMALRHLEYNPEAFKKLQSIVAYAACK